MGSNQVILPTDNIVFREGRGQYIVKCMTIPSDYSGIQFTSAVSGVVTGMHSWYQGELQWYVNEKGQLCSADGTFRLGRHGVLIKSKSAEHLHYPDDWGGIIAGSTLINGSVIAKKLSDSSKAATTGCVFSSPDYNHVEWTAGTLVLADGTSFAIGAGSTGVLTALSYIYFDRKVSQTEFQVTTEYSDLASDTAILVCNAKPASSSDLLAHFVSINGWMLLNINQLNVNYLSALSADLGDVLMGTMRFGAATSFTEGAGIWARGDDEGLAEWRIGNPATNRTISFTTATGLVTFGSGVAFQWGQVGGSGKPADNATVGADWGSNVTGRPTNLVALGDVPGFIKNTYIDGTEIKAPNITGNSILGGNIVASSGGTNTAGLTGEGSGDSAVRGWAGATYANRANAPFRYTQGGEVVTKLLTMYSSGGEIGLMLDGEGIDLWDSQGHVYLKAVNSTLRIKGGANNDTPFEVFYEGTKIFGVGYDTVEANFIEAPQIRSSVATGKAPFKVSSTTVVSNLNADRIDGQHGPFAAQSHNHSGVYLPIDGQAVSAADSDALEGYSASFFAQATHNHNGVYHPYVTPQFSGTITPGGFDYIYVTNGVITGVS